LDSQVPRNVRDGCSWLLAQRHYLTFELVREAPSGSCHAYLQPDSSLAVTGYGVDVIKMLFLDELSLEMGGNPPIAL
jgi:hypothetical protein